MKNITFLFMFLMTFVGFSQGHETFDDFDAQNGNSYSTGTFTGQDGSTWNYVEARNDADAEITVGDQAIMLGRNRTPTSELSSGTISNGIGTLEFTYMQAFGSDVELEVSVNNNVIATVTSNNEQGVVKSSGQITVNAGGNVTIKFSNPNGGQVNIDDVIWTAVGSDPTLSISSPGDGAELAPNTDPTIVFGVTNFDISSDDTTGDGDGYIKYQVDNDNFKNYFSEDPIELNGLAPGQHTVMLHLVNNNGDTLVPGVMSDVTFTIKNVISANSVEELRDGDLGSYYTLSSEAIVTYQQDFRNQKYIQDETGAILIDDDSETITSSYDRYDGITGLTGMLTDNNGTLEIQPTEDPGNATSSGNKITPLIVTIDDLNNDAEAYESQLIAIEDIEFTGADGSETFATGVNYEISDGNDTIIMRTNFYDADYIGDIIPQGMQSNIVGIASHFQNDGQIFMRDSNDFNQDLGIEDFNKSDVVLYPNPATNHLNIQLEGNAQVQVYSMLGQQVINTEISNNATIDVAGLNAGIYLVKIQKEGHSLTQKLVIK